MPRRFLLLLVLLLPAVPTSGGRAETLERCLKERFVAARLACLPDLAIRRRDPFLCLNGDPEAVRWTCAGRYAAEVGQLSVCRMLPDSDSGPPGMERELCRLHVAIEKDEPDLCEDLKTPVYADACRLQVVVEGGGDPALCGRIETDSLRRACQSEIHKTGGN